MKGFYTPPRCNVCQDPADWHCETITWIGDLCDTDLRCVLRLTSPGGILTLERRTDRLEKPPSLIDDLVTSVGRKRRGRGITEEE